MNDKIKIKEKLAFAMTNVGNIPIQTLIGSFLLIFYTNIVGLDPAACATLFLVARILLMTRLLVLPWIICRQPNLVISVRP